jgi:hypothetical protein
MLFKLPGISDDSELEAHFIRREIILCKIKNLYDTRGCNNVAPEEPHNLKQRFFYLFFTDSERYLFKFSEAQVLKLPLLSE